MKRNRSKVTNWATIFQDVTNNPKSGENGEQMLQRAHDLYEGKHGEKFKFVGCYEVLRESPKFATNLGNKEDEDTAFSNVGATIQRPTGQKIAKKREKETRDAVYRSNKRVQASKETAQATQQLAAAATQMANVMSSRKRFEQDRFLIALCREKGDEEKAGIILQEMLADRALDRNREEQSQQAPAAGLIGSLCNSIPSHIRGSNDGSSDDSSHGGCRLSTASPSTASTSPMVPRRGTSRKCGRCACGPSCIHENMELRPEHRCCFCKKIVHVLCVTNMGDEYFDEANDDYSCGCRKVA